MLTSMTSFGRAEALLPARKGAGGGRATAEIRTVNHRFLEVEVRLPEGLQGFEQAARAAVGKAISRGQVRLSVAVKTPDTAIPVAVNPRLARAYAQELKRLKRDLGLTGGVELGMLLTLPQVLRPADRPELGAGQWPSIERAVHAALAEALRMRRREGKQLGKAVQRLLWDMQVLAQKIRRRVPQEERRMEKRLIEKIRAVSGRVSRSVPERQMVLAQIADFVHSTDVREELDRIEAHLMALKATIAGLPLEAKGAVTSPGRTIDFLAQELHREVNTLGTKFRDTSVVQWVVQMKGQIEKLREQAANLE